MTRQIVRTPQLWREGLHRPKLNKIKNNKMKNRNKAGFARRPELPKGIVLKGNKRTRAFMFTLNNPTAEDCDRMTDWLDEENRIDGAIANVLYMRAQLEKGEQGTPHLQGYAVLKQPRRLTQIKELIGGLGGANRPHIEERRGTHRQAKDYCSKEESRVAFDDGGYIIEFGKEPNQGRAGIRRMTDMDNLAKDIEDGASLNDIQENYPGSFLLHENKVVDRFIQNKGRRHLKPDNNNVHIYIGPSGSGKTTTAWRLYPNAYKGVWPTGGRWWFPNYRGEKVMIFDEFRENISYQQMLALLDIHPMSIEYKGGNTQNVSKKIIITSIRDPKEWYKKVQDKSELQRRIRENCRIFDFEGGRQPPNFKCEPRTEIFEFDPYEEDQGLNFNRKFD